MIDKIFIDTNLLVYGYNADDEIKHEKINTFFDTIQRDSIICVSTQVINEFYNTLYRKKVPLNKIKLYLNEIIHSLNIVTPDVNTSIKAIELQEKYKYSWWDSLILSTAIENECNILYTEDFHNDQVIENKLAIINPFYVLKKTDKTG